MISHEHKCVFVHIPKCAGTSIEHVLGHFDDFEGRQGQDHRSVRMMDPKPSFSKILLDPDNAKDFIRSVRHGYRQHKNPRNASTLTPKQYNDYFFFTFVRNPWERCFSWYKNVMRDEIHQKNYNVPPTISFDDFMKEYAGTGYLRPQTYWLKNYNGTLDDIDYTGKFESLAEDFETIAQKLDLESISLPHKIKGSTAKTIDMSASVARFISRYYEEEIELFGYQNSGYMK